MPIRHRSNPCRSSRDQTGAWILASDAKRLHTTERKRPAQSLSIRRTIFSIWCKVTARRYVTASASAPGFTWSGVHAVSGKKEWPDWVPPDEMIKRQPYLPHFVAGGPNNPLGARALYLGSTLYRIHGSNEPWTIGQNVSSGCIRMRNADVIDLYERVKVGTKIVVL